MARVCTVPYGMILYCWVLYLFAFDIWCTNLRVILLSLLIKGILAIEIFQLRQKATSVISSLSRLGRNPSSAKYMESITLSKNQNKP
jgi:Flp pilus assembly protein protease CpaA